MKKVPNQAKASGLFLFGQATGYQRMGTDARILSAGFIRASVKKSVEDVILTDMLCVHPSLDVLIPASLMKGII